MNMKSLLRTFVSVAAFATASFANAGPITEAGSWSTGGDADVATVTSTASGIDLFYSRGTYFCAGCGDHYFEFKTSVDAAGIGAFDFSYNAFNGWFMAGSDLTLLVNDAAVAFYGGDNTQASFLFAFNAGDVLKFRAHETNGDSQPYIDGHIRLSNLSGVFAPATNDVPEPTSLALMGLGLLGAVAAGRKRALRK
jgi:hypothetical protein